MLQGFRNAWEKEFLRYEFFLSVVATVALIVWSEWFGAKRPICNVLDDNRGNVYGTWASVLGALLGFAIATEAVVLSFIDRRRFNRLAESPRAYDQLWMIFMSCIRWLGIATATAMVALIWDRNSHPNIWALYAVLGTGIIASARIIRTVWILELVIKLLTKRPQRGEG